MSRYNFPMLQHLNCLYSGRRYKVYGIDGEHPYEGYEDMGNFFIYDGLYGGVSVVGTMLEGSVIGALAFSHVKVEVPTQSNLKDFVKVAARVQEAYHKATVG